MGFSGGILDRSITVILLSFVFLSFNSTVKTQAGPKEKVEKASDGEQTKPSAGQQIKILCSKLVSFLPKKKALTPEAYEALKKSGASTTSAIKPTESATSKTEKPIDPKKEAVLISALKDFQSATNEIQKTLSAENSALDKEVMIKLFNNLKILADNGASLGLESRKLIFSSLMRYYTSNPAFIAALQKAIRSNAVSSRQIASFDNSILDFVRTAFPDYESAFSSTSPEYQLIRALRIGSPHLGIKQKVDQSWKLTVSLWMREQAGKATALDRQLKKQKSEGKIDEETFAKRRQGIRNDYWYIGKWQARQTRYRQLSSQLRRAWGSIRSLPLEDIASLAAIDRSLQASTDYPTDRTTEVPENIFQDGDPIFADEDLETGNNASDTDPGISNFGDDFEDEPVTSEIVEVDRSGEHLALDDSGDVPIESSSAEAPSQIRFTQTTIGKTGPVKTEPAEDPSKSTEAPSSEHQEAEPDDSSTGSGDSSVGGIQLVDDD